MKQGLILVTILFISYHVRATTCMGDVILTNQNMINSFVVCDTVDGNLIIDGSMMPTITDLSNLNGIKVVTGRLMVDNTNLISLNGLQSLVEINNLVIQFNNNLTDINALAGVNITTGAIVIQSNGALGQCCAIASQVTNPMFFVNDQKNLAGGNCNFLADIQADTSCDTQAVPTIGQWAIIHLSLLLLIIGSLSLLQKPKISQLNNN